MFGRRRDEEERRDELLSAYLDGELSQRERELLEVRLSEDPALRADLRAVHRTMSLVRDLPEVAAPRNFILSESMVERRRPVEAGPGARPEPSRRARAWAAPLLTAATMLVSLLFIVVLAGDLLLPQIGGLASAPAPMASHEEAPEMMMEAAPTDDAGPREAEPEKSEPADLGSPPPVSAAESAGEESPEEPEMAVEEEEADMEATRAAQAPAGAGGTPPPEREAGPTEEGGTLAVPTVAPTVTAVTAHTPTIPAEPPVISEDERGLAEPRPGQSDATPELTQEERVTDGFYLPSSVWGVLEVTLGIAALVLTFATFRAWRQRRR